MKDIELQRIISLKLKLIRRGIGIHVAENGIYVAEVRRTLTGVELSKAHFEPFPDTIHSTEEGPARQKYVAAAIQKCCAKAGIKGGEVYTSPAASQVVTRYFQVPAVSEKEQEDAIRFEGSRYVPYRLDETVVGYSIKPARDKENLDVVFNAIRIDVLRSHVNAVEAGKIKVFDSEPPFYSLARAIHNQKKRAESKNCILHFAVDGAVSVSMYRGDIFYVCRDFYLSPDDPKHPERFFSEFQSSLDYFNRQLGETGLPEHVYVAGDWNLKMWAQILDKFFNGKVPVEIPEFPMKTGLAVESANTFLVPIGLALRAIGEHLTPYDVSFLGSGVVAEERRAPRKWTGAVILTLLLLGVGYYFGYYMPRMHQLKQTLGKLKFDEENLNIASPQFALESVSALQKRLSDLETKNKIVQAFQESRSLIGDKLITLSQTIPVPIWFSDLQYQQTFSSGNALAITDRQLSMNGYIYYREIPEEELRQINDYADELRKNDSFMKGFAVLKLEGVERTSYLGRNFTKFRIIAHFNTSGRVNK
ncbi:MAG: hypothetical protein COV74_08280 [Candidatus Omnitrophica bacterium CG11_big_fil_rev_8_21_14_0_20_45_26]|uniref:SHS2 domain-containing protein n=1 Tax=Candidatus Abzuiibacterium crystallinum TaxID=1974748 RepID=A0A2H0LM56_9BACT|nr:MAG: hypothetical protein COV74_08280 [Candidatus Omnitrophica bacterium CG11_big_fil_rev_8_21_14_0_20_45_26]PIW63658.1 MAG: hypothetical protein COW12_09165 [Candidatus Omnitrophica bacterium CG12_big_fil_rev_8_21_14_0_65_45_16]